MSIIMEPSLGQDNSDCQFKVQNGLQKGITQQMEVSRVGCQFWDYNQDILINYNME